MDKISVDSVSSSRSENTGDPCSQLREDNASLRSSDDELACSSIKGKTGSPKRNSLRLTKRSSTFSKSLRAFGLRKKACYSVSQLEQLQQHQQTNVGSKSTSSLDSGARSSLVVSFVESDDEDDHQRRSSGRSKKLSGFFGETVTQGSISSSNSIGSLSYTGVSSGSVNSSQSRRSGGETVMSKLVDVSDSNFKASQSPRSCRGSNYDHTPSLAECVKVMHEGTTFLKWDSNSKPLMYLFQLDPYNCQISWSLASNEKSKRSADNSLLISEVKEVRLNAITMKEREQAKRYFEKHGITATDDRGHSLSFAIVYGRHVIDVTLIRLVATVESTLRIWTTGLQALLEAAKVKSVDPTTAYLTKQYLTLFKNGRADMKAVIGVLGKENKSRFKEILAFDIGLEYNKKVTFVSDPENIVDPEFERHFPFHDFHRVYSRLHFRQDISEIFGRLAKGKRPYLTAQQFYNFLVNTQGESKEEVTDEYVKKLIELHEDTESMRNQCVLTQQGLSNFLSSGDNDVYRQSYLRQHMDMTQPFNHYFINSSHNSYLTGHQLRGESSVEMYVQILLTGCRCLELDCWNGDDGEPIIWHGHTLTTKIKFQDVVYTINEYAFAASPYPVILSFENHCSEEQQVKMANYCKTIFGDKLVSEFLVENPQWLPSPEALRERILIKNKKRVVTQWTSSVSTGALEYFNTRKLSSPSVGINDSVKGYSDVGSNSALSDSPHNKLENSSTECDWEFNGSLNSASSTKIKIRSSAPTSERVELVDIGDAEEEFLDEEDEAVKDVCRSSMKAGLSERVHSTSGVAQELSDLVIYTQSVRFKNFTNSSIHGKCYSMSSFSESTAERFLKRDQRYFVEYNYRRNCRIYPSGRRIDSSNYDPQTFWNLGCQMVALNFQSSDVPMQLNTARFLPNGNCGYILKPLCYRKDNAFDPGATYAEFLSGRTVKDIRIDHIIPKLLKIQIISGQNLSTRMVSAYVEIEIFGLAMDQRSQNKFRSKTVSNTLNPVWYETMKARIIMPELAMLRMTVLDASHGLLGQCILPYDAIKMGYRYIPLKTAKNEPIPVCSLFIKFEEEEEVPDQHTDLLAALMCGGGGLDLNST